MAVSVNQPAELFGSGAKTPVQRVNSHQSRHTRLACNRREEGGCFSDEHWMPTVLAAAGAGGDTSCANDVMWADWERDRPVQAQHPFTYLPQACISSPAASAAHAPCCLCLHPESSDTQKE